MMRALAPIALTLLLAAGWPATALSMSAAPPAPEAPAPYAEGQVLLKFRPGVPEEGRQRVLIEEESTVERVLGGSGVLLVRLPPGRSVPDGVAGFARHPEVEYAEPNHKVTIQ